MEAFLKFKCIGDLKVDTAQTGWFQLPGRVHCLSETRAWTLGGRIPTTATEPCSLLGD